MMKKKAIACLAMALVCTMIVPAFAAEPNGPTLIAGEPAETAGTVMEDIGRYAVAVDGADLGAEACIMVPLRAVAEALGFTVTWDHGTVLVDNGTIHTIVTIGEDLYAITTSIEGADGMSAPFSLGIPPYVTKGVTYVPLSLFRALMPEAEITVENGRVSIQTSSGTQIPNPFLECSTLDEAAALAGFPMTAPEHVAGYNAPVFRAIERDMLEILYRSDNGTGELCIRKAAGSGDISGDYNAYPDCTTVRVGERSVTMQGHDGKIVLATWTDGGYAFSIRAAGGIDRADMEALITAVA